jgi:hypothetical protein
LKTQVVAVRKKTPAQLALEKELKDRNPILIQELKDFRKQINDLEKQRGALQKGSDRVHLSGSILYSQNILHFHSYDQGMSRFGGEQVLPPMLTL